MNRITLRQTLFGTLTHNLILRERARYKLDLSQVFQCIIMRRRMTVNLPKGWDSKARQGPNHPTDPITIRGRYSTMSI